MFVFVFDAGRLLLTGYNFIIIINFLYEHIIGPFVSNARKKHDTKIKKPYKTISQDLLARFVA